MTRIIGILVGLFFTVAVLWAFATGAYTVISEGQLKPETAEHEFHKHPKHLALASDGAFGKFDKQQLQRGFQVYKEVCSACHSLRLVAFRDLAALGYNEAEIKAIAAGFQVPGVDPNTGEATTRAGMATDYFPKPYPNDIAARAANNNAVPPDLSLMTKARHDGAAYVYSLLTGYQKQPAELIKKFPDSKTGAGLHYNPYFANLNLAMAPPLTGTDQVTYGDGTKATVDQMAKDVSAFLTWTAEPKLDKRKQTGWPVLGFLLFATVLAYLAKQQVWAGKKGKKA
ncbi:ubiquinol-cytochrome c reductase cytochrome c1 subunit [Caenibius tardaugens NBRC 16725]|uniref:Cytochrome c1 n=1 Tax=Caenibius tardaugens NBRC 16725 TaxID=1219035 RepID=U3A2N6_9SPHN|nr:cytochrome c1 [Caenibius tardaugens]AZI35932.1 cytochrome c1 [Caenibius tardaugens NBRC 16725]GAD49018.1 ubiquinol-cytochrome c reductase cytochrome c1 subunit [Caenibius tardaugens NBRC 16725]